MSFGALSANAIRALNRGAKLGGFAHDTGEGGISRYHREFGGDLIWEIGSGYFGCRNEDGSFCADRFATQAQERLVKMVEIKLSQGAKPGHGGVLPGAKVTAEIANARGVPIGIDCVSPARHSAFKTPVEMMHFIAQLRDLSGGKPVGFKLCIGHAWEFMALCKAMLETGIRPGSLLSTDRKAAPARRRSNSSITLARRCAKVWCSPTIVWWERDCGNPFAWARAGGW
jgi:glutamate synthase domain-containing protein 2